MKVKLTPTLAYIIGFWRKRKCKEGLGIYGTREFQEIFSTTVFEEKLTTPNEMLTREDNSFFYHTAYKKFFLEVENEQLERFKYHNEYAAYYLAGWFDSDGAISDKGIVYLHKVSDKDEMLFLRLGFPLRKKGEYFMIEKPRAFLLFIKNYVKKFKDHPVFALIKEQKKEAPTN